MNREQKVIKLNYLAFFLILMGGLFFGVYKKTTFEDLSYFLALIAIVQSIFYLVKSGLTTKTKFDSILFYFNISLGLFSIINIFSLNFNVNYFIGLFLIVNGLYYFFNNYQYIKRDRLSLICLTSSTLIIILGIMCLLELYTKYYLMYNNSSLAIAISGILFIIINSIMFDLFADVKVKVITPTKEEVKEKETIENNEKTNKISDITKKSSSVSKKSTLANSDKATNKVSKKLTKKATTTTSKKPTQKKSSLDKISEKSTK